MKKMKKKIEVHNILFFIQAVIKIVSAIRNKSLRFNWNLCEICLVIKQISSGVNVPQKFILAKRTCIMLKTTRPSP